MAAAHPRTGPSARLTRLSHHLPSTPTPAGAADDAEDPQLSRGDIVLPSGRTRPQVYVRHGWQLSLHLAADTSVIGGDPAHLAAAIEAGCDMRVATNFPHAEHIDPNSGFGDLIGEVAGFQVTYLVRPEGGEPWVAGTMTQRQPIECPTGFGPRSSMSFFLYNQDGHQAIARPFLDGEPPTGGKSGPEKVVEDAVYAPSRPETLSTLCSEGGRGGTD